MYFHDKRLTRALQGLMLAWVPALGWYLIRAFQGHEWPVEFTAHWGYYLYMILGNGVTFTAFGWYTGGREEVLEELSIRDGLTGLYNNRFFDARLPEEYARAKRHGNHLSLILIDIDEFREINERHGHDVGDQVLAELGRVLLQQARKEEFVARTGGEEFCIILTECGEKHARTAATRFLQAIRDLRVVSDRSQTVQITASMGVVSTETTEGDEWQLYQVADAARYRAKRNGRNQVAIV